MNTPQFYFASPVFLCRYMYLVYSTYYMIHVCTFKVHKTGNNVNVMYTSSFYVCIYDTFY